MTLLIYFVIVDHSSFLGQVPYRKDLTSFRSYLFSIINYVILILKTAFHSVFLISNAYFSGDICEQLNV